MAHKFDKNAKIEVGKYKGLAYDISIMFNAIKEKKLGSAFRKQNARTDNIINRNLESELTLKIYDIEEKLQELRNISNIIYL
jgi:hypothetical protein